MPLDESVIFLAGETQQTVTVQIIQDSLIEGDEHFTLTAVYFVNTASGPQREQLQAQILIQSEDQRKL